jgi:predicted Zn-dependent peptidase
MVRRSQLTNGLRIVTAEMPGVPSVTLGVWVENGSRYEEERQGGISHFLEHLFFKGTERRTAAQIAEEIDAVGGVLNAFTGKEYTCYYAKVLAEHLPLAQDLLADIFLRSRFDPAEIDRERSVVTQEILQVEDTPDDYVHDLFNAHFWPGHPLGLPICGRVDTVGRFVQRDFLDFLEARYRPDRIILAAAGNLRHEALCEWTSQEFGALDGRARAADTPPPAPQSGLLVVEKPLEQVHICLGMPGLAQAAPERYAAYLMNTALGGGMSSRLFQEVRERRGRAYSVYSFLSCYHDAGYLGVYVGTSSDWTEEVVTTILAELDRLAADGLTEAELGRVKNQLKGNLLLGLETSDNHMHRIAKNELYYGRDVTPEEVAAQIDGVTLDDVAALAQRLLRPRRLTLTVLGDLKGHSLNEEMLVAA